LEAHEQAFKSWRDFYGHKFIGGTEPKSLNRWQQAFCEWNSQRLAILPEEIGRRFPEFLGP
jgi:hypothetical protein